MTAPAPTLLPDPLKAHIRRLVGTTLAGNLGSALLTFVYFRFLDPLALGDAGPPGAAEVGYFVARLSLLFLSGHILPGRWSGPVINVPGALPTAQVKGLLQRLRWLPWADARRL